MHLTGELFGIIKMNCKYYAICLVEIFRNIGIHLLYTLVLLEVHVICMFMLLFMCNV